MKFYGNDPTGKNTENKFETPKKIIKPTIDENKKRLTRSSTPKKIEKVVIHNGGVKPLYVNKKIF